MGGGQSVLAALGEEASEDAHALEGLGDDGQDGGRRGVEAGAAARQLHGVRVLDARAALGPVLARARRVVCNENPGRLRERRCMLAYTMDWIVFAGASTTKVISPVSVVRV